ncbi:MAG: FAD-dependent oxidoreductase, partial [Betaproteobacteria bacterium]|nr:FAD-dependent oxidoreductase [Betaproteobacteria bacterium]
MDAVEFSGNCGGGLPSSADAVIVGGGIMGCALAYHLARAGMGVVLLEKSELTSGSTWHAAGQITRAVSNRALAWCVDYNIALYKKLPEETGHSATWHGCGSLRLAYTEDEADWLRHIVSTCAGAGFDAEIVPPERIRELHPFYNLDGVRCALHTPDDGHLDPSGATVALAKGARMAGAKIFRRCRVLDIQKTAGGWRVQTEKGEIICEHIVNAGGAFARQIALWNGYDLPAVSMTHHYFVTEPCAEFAALEKELPVVRDDRMVSGYVRMEQKSGLVGIYEKENPRTVWDGGAPWQSENELFEPDYGRVEKWLSAAFARMPPLANLGIRLAVHGAISHPPDGMPLVGPAPGLRNYWCCCGCQIGIGWGPGLAAQLARWMTAGAADISMREFDPRRFGREANREYQTAKAREDYILRHEIPFPHFNRLAARPGEQSSLYEILQKKGAVHEEVGGWERPRWFAKNGAAARDIYSFRRTALHEIVGAETAAVRGRAGVMDISAFAKAEVRGKDAAAFVGGLIPNRLPAPGRIALAHFLSENGRIEMEATVMRPEEDRFYIVCAAFFENRLWDYLNFRRGNAAVELANRSREWAALAVNGPLARAVVRKCLPRAADAELLPWLRTRAETFGGGELLACRISYAGESGWEFHGAPAAVAALYRALWEAAAGRGLADYGSFAMNAMRIEKAFRGAGELNNEVNMAEADVMRFADLQKPDFVGKAATARAAANPLKWKCVYLEIETDGVFDGAGGEAVFADGARTGALTSVD